MSLENGGNKVPELEQQEKIDSSLSGPLRNALFLFLEHAPVGTKLFVVDKFTSGKYPTGRFVSDRETGIGEIRFADTVEKGTIQIYLGNNTWKVVEMPMDGMQQTAGRGDRFFGRYLSLDAESFRAVREFQQKYSERQDRGKSKDFGIVMGAGPQRSEKIEPHKSPFEQLLERYGLASERIAPFNTVQDVVEKIFLDSGHPYFIDIQTQEGQEEFCQTWFETCGRRSPRPFVPPEHILKRWVPTEKFPDKVDKDEGDFRYLVLLAQSRVVTNLLEKGDKNEIALPLFTETSGYIDIMDWREVDPQKTDSWGKSFLESPSASTPLLEKFGIIGVMTTREGIDKALWEGDPGDYEPSQLHKQVITDMGFDPTEYMFRLVDYGEYFRLAPRLGWGILETHFDGYGIDITDPDQRRYGLCCSTKDCGQVPHANFSDPKKKLAVRLVLVRR